MRFTAYLNDELRGFYRSSYIENGVTKYLAVSQFEAVDARRSFPCFDEPAMKATFNITLGRNESWTSASNMPLMATIPMEDEPGFVWDIFEPSIKMSTYLVAFLVSEFVNVESDPALSNVLFRIWARPAFRNQTEYARDIGPRVLEYYEQFFDVGFPLPKQDMAAVPDFAAGAMENWGLITYREADLLIDPKKTSASSKQRVCIVIAHEVAHQWFGDLVTMQWWNGIWLNEGFASYMEVIGTDAVEPSFKMKEQFVIEKLQYVFGIDALESSRPINVEVNTPDEINGLFDAISYEKGASIIRMASAFLGAETFQKGLTRYFNEHAYGNTEQDDLWAALNQQAAADGVFLPAPVKTIMDTWTLKMGYPLINVTRNYDTSSITMTQERFLLRKSNDSSDTTVYQWWVPLTLTSDFNEPTISTWMQDNQQSIVLTNLGVPSNRWLIVNVDQLGYYRVAYDPTNYGLIREQLLLDHTVVAVNNRAQLLDDSLNIASVNLIPYAEALDLTLYLTVERDFVPFDSALTALGYIDGMLSATAGYADWQMYMTSLIDPLYNYVGYDESADDDHLLNFLRGDALNWASKLNNVDFVARAIRQYAFWMQNPTNDEIISPNQLRVISCAAIRNGGNAEWDFAFQKYQASEFATEKSALLSALGCTLDSAILSTMLELMIDPESGIRLQDAQYVFTYVAGNSVGNPLAFAFLRDRWDDIYSYFYGYYSMAGFFRTVSSRYNTQEKLSELLVLRDAHLDVLGGSRTVEQAIAVVEANIKWINNNYAEVIDWLQNHRSH